MRLYASVLSRRSDFEFNIIGGPLETPDDHTPLFAALGFAGSAWARMEQQLDIVLIYINKEQRSRELYQPEYPVSFERKIKLAKRWFNQHPPLKPYREDIRLFTSKIKEIAPIRNYLLHSILLEWDPKRKVATMQAIKFEGHDNFRVQRRAVSLKTIKTFGGLRVISARGQVFRLSRESRGAQRQYDSSCPFMARPGSHPGRPAGPVTG